MHRRLTIALCAAVIYFFALIPVLVVLWIIGTEIDQTDWFWHRLLTMVIGAGLSLPAIVIVGVALFKLGHHAPDVTRTRAMAAILAGALSLGEATLLSAFLLPRWQNLTDRVYG